MERRAEEEQLAVENARPQAREWALLAAGTLNATLSLRASGTFTFQETRESPSPARYRGTWRQLSENALQFVLCTPELDPALAAPPRGPKIVCSFRDGRILWSKDGDGSTLPFMRE